MYGRGTLEDHERKQRPGTRLLYSHSTSCSAEQPAVVLNSLLSEFTSDQFASTASIDTNGSHSVLAVVGAESQAEFSSAAQPGNSRCFRSNFSAAQPASSRR